MKRGRHEDMDRIKERHEGRVEVTGIPNIPVVCSHLPSGLLDSCYYGMENIQPLKMGTEFSLSLSLFTDLNSNIPNYNIDATLPFHKTASS